MDFVLEKKEEGDFSVASFLSHLFTKNCCSPFSIDFEMENTFFLKKSVLTFRHESPVKFISGCGWFLFMGDPVLSVLV